LLIIAINQIKLFSNNFVKYIESKGFKRAVLEKCSKWG